jgi:MFS family permease
MSAEATDTKPAATTQEGHRWWLLLDLTLFRNRTVSAAVTAGLLAALVIGGALLPLLYFLQTVQKVSPISAILRLMPLMVAAAAFAPVAGALTARIGPRKVIAAGLVLMAAGSSLLIFLAPETPYGQVLTALVLLGAGDIAVITPVADVILSAVPRERTGSAAAVNGAAMQIGGALGTAVLTSVLLAVARAAYYQRLKPSGLSRQEITAATEALRRSIQTGAESGGQAVPQPVLTQLASVGAGAVFTCSVLVCLLCAVLVWFRLSIRMKLKGGFIVGAQHGEGALLSGGRTLGYYNTIAASYGLQAGVQKFGYALFFMTNSSLAYLDKSGGWELGTGPSIVVVDTGMAKSLTTTTLQKGVYALFFDQKGLMAGLGLQGSKITRITPPASAW